MTETTFAAGREHPIAGIANADLAALILRVTMGIFFLAHTWLKLFIFTPAGTAAFFESLGFPGFLAYVVIAAEGLGGIALILGLWSRWVSLAMVPIWVDRLCFVCAPDHPLAALPRPSLQALCAHDAVLPGPHTFTRGLIEARFAAAGLRLPVALSTNYLETLKMMTAIGLGWSLLPERLVAGELHELTIDHPPIHRPLGYLVHRSRTLSNAARAMLAALEAAREPAAKTAAG